MYPQPKRFVSMVPELNAGYKPEKGAPPKSRQVLKARHPTEPKPKKPLACHMPMCKPIFSLWSSRTILGPFWDHLWGPFWDQFRINFWTILGQFLGPFWGRFGAILGPFLDHFEVLWPPVAAAPAPARSGTASCRRSRPAAIKGELRRVLLGCSGDLVSGLSNGPYGACYGGLWGDSGLAAVGFA